MKQLAFLIPYFLADKYIGIFVLNYLTSVIVPLPGAAILLIVGALAHRGYVNIFIAFLTAFSATVAGDVTAYYSTRFFGTEERLERYRRRNRTFRIIEKYIKRHPYSTIFISRFVGFSTSAANFIAGFIVMPIQTFLIADCIANALCVALYLVMGYTVGRVWSHANLLMLTGIAMTVFAAIYGLIMAGAYLIQRNEAKASA